MNEADLREFRRLRTEKGRVTAELHSLLQRSAGRPFSADERHSWADLYGRWKDVASEITARMQRFWERLVEDRRHDIIRQRERRAARRPIEPERREGQDRRALERRSHPDRRDPFAQVS
ncbi:MAG TPA: hypothetical protein VGA37_09970 [Gemmatimonadales bacterium]